VDDAGRASRRYGLERCARRCDPSPAGDERTVNVAVGALVVVVVTAIAVALMLLVRRSAPEGSYFADGDRAAGVFGVLATGFSVLLGFVVFLAFTSYDTARAGAETEALVVAEQLETAQFFAPDVAAELTAGLVCYARSVAGVQWERMQAGTIGDSVNPWAIELYRTVRGVEPATAAEQSAYDRWLDQTSAREEARMDRVHGAVGVIPTTLWVVLFFSALLVLGFVLFFGDPGERAVAQALLMGSVAATLTATLLLLYTLNHPFHDGIGGLRPVAMQRTLRVIDEEVDVISAGDIDRCDEMGNPR
jgi:hypothetical protein